MKTFLLYLSLLTTSAIAMAQELNSPTDEQIELAVEASKKTRGATTFWRSDEFGLIFGYDARWKPANLSQKSTAFVVNWTSSKSSGLMATCYLEINDSQLGRLTPRQIQKKSREIADAYLRNGRLRDPDMQLIDWRLAAQDNHPVIYIERDMSVTNLNDTIHARIYSVVTSWRGREVNMECSSSIPVTTPKLAGVVEGPIRKVLGSLQFVRAVQ